MLKNINLQRVLKAMFISFIFIFVTNIMNDGNRLFTQNFLISFLIYSVLGYVALYGFELNWILGFFLFLSISLLSPNLYPSFEGELFPITYVMFALFLTYILGRGMYKKWKTSL
jgi:hypothetical protein